MVRDGAQDFLVKNDLDCSPLARAIRNALERHRLLEAARSTCMTDQLTGLLTSPAFLTLAKRDHLLAERLNLRMMVLMAECVEPEAMNGVRAPGVGDYSGQEHDLALVEAADDLRRIAGPAALLGRLSHSHFGLASLDTIAESVEEVRARLQAAESAGKLAYSAAMFDPRQPASLDVLLEQAAEGLRSKPGRLLV
jgi:GGDEF domain-containing protein